MLEWTRKLLDKLGAAAPRGSTYAKIVEQSIDGAVDLNGSNAEREMGMPRRLWRELTTEYRLRHESILAKGRAKQLTGESIFMLGVSVGWREAREIDEQESKRFV